MKERILTGLIMLAVAIFAFTTGGIVADLLILAFAAVGSYEIVRIFKDKWPSFTMWVLPFAMTGITALGMFAPKYVFAAATLFLLTVSYLFVQYETVSVEDVAVVVFVALILLLGVIYAKRAYDIGFWMFVYICVGTFMNDTGAYFVGRCFGKHKLNERISPKKTIEGSVGGFACGVVCSIVVAYLTLPQYSIWLMTIISVCMGVAGPLGDLCFSAVKRHYGIKDYGNIFPGHGGVLDRVDSLLFNLIVVFAIMGMVM
ncbi:MAG: phosphatidate cytidylyltransferase [Erysipelotrichaceae bacterium]|nr:phosphatidate cytidylyltransferase [Erysipelotrichaceae bacterium]